ncbi:MAG: hypothetical protein JSU96_00315 [Acidobacteriota bacterium]|nr:MAG: hypothetical protein JSU96_00315 [Acidobacteriota bacterium]
MKTINRRTLLAAMGALPVTRLSLGSAQALPSYEDYVAGMAWEKAAIDQFLDPSEPNWATFDPLVGYRHSNAVMKDGIDGSYCIYRMEPSGERRKIHFADRPCRINTYGDSFTHCDQVSDGETWQEYLAAHFGEPVRNFGTGGYGVYQAYRRMLREEGTDSSAPFVLFNVWIDDHRRSMMSVRWFHIRFFRDLIAGLQSPYYFHANPWCHVRFDLDSGELREFENTHPKPEDLYLICDPEYVVSNYRDDLYLQMEYAMDGGNPPNLERMKRLAELVGLEARWDSQEAISKSAEQLFWHSGMKASEVIVQWARKWADENQKKLLFLVSYRGGDVAAACRQEPRLDQVFIDYLNREQVPYVDSLQKHVEDYEQFSLPLDRYLKRYYNGHYAPAGNHFFAFAIKDDLLKWLDPAPFTYQKDQPSIADISAVLAL